MTERLSMNFGLNPPNFSKPFVLAHRIFPASQDAFAALPPKIYLKFSEKKPKDFLDQRKTFFDNKKSPQGGSFFEQRRHVAFCSQPNLLQSGDGKPRVRVRGQPGCLQEIPAERGPHEEESSIDHNYSRRIRVRAGHGPNGGTC
jgi:hypothetical protein